MCVPGLPHHIDHIDRGDGATMSSGAAVGLPRSVESSVVRTARHEADVEVAGPPSSTSSQRSDGLLVGLHG